MVKRIIYTQENGIVAIISPAQNWIDKKMAEGNTEEEAFELLKIKAISNADERATAKIAEDESEVKEILDITGVDQSNENSSENSTSLEQSILKKINN